MSPKHQRGNIVVAATRRLAPKTPHQDTGTREPRRHVLQITPVKQRYVFKRLRGRGSSPAARCM